MSQKESPKENQQATKQTDKEVGHEQVTRLFEKLLGDPGVEIFERHFGTMEDFVKADDSKLLEVADEMRLRFPRQG